jgi:serine/threonine-protein kinase
VSAPGAGPPELARLAAFGEPGGPALDEALRAFAYLRSTPHERGAIDCLLARDARSPLPDALVVALASALLDRGQPADAQRVLARATSPTALMMSADLAAEAGDRSRAVALVERVLLHDIDWPGARERFARWADAPRTSPQPHGAWETVVAGPPEAPFELLREIGRGGAATVYEATDRVLGRRVALKMYHQPDRDRAQLGHEARVAVLLSGPGIVRIFDVDPRQGWIALEWAPLGALGTLIRLRRLEVLLPLQRWAIPLAAALARVHAAGWVHHDVKPANVALRSPETPILTDFGIARRIGEPSPPGSAGYVSPERLAGRASDPRDDVYGFGRILEDALEACASEGQPGHPRSGPRESGVSLGHWRSLATSCTGPDEKRPKSGEDLLARAAGGLDH